MAEIVGTVGFYEKIVCTKNIIEVWRYERLNTRGGGAHENEGKNTSENYKQRQRTRRVRIRQLICANFDSSSKFVTLTFNDSCGFDIRDVKACNKHFKQFVQRMRRRYPNFKYVAVIEFQDANGRGAVHYHMICNLPYIRKSELQQIWRAGFVKINAIDKVDNVGAYVVKYMVADMDDTRLCGLQAYLHSRNLDEPKVVKSWDESSFEYFRLADAIKEKSPSYVSSYESEQAGHVQYFQFNDNRKSK